MPIIGGGTFSEDVDIGGTLTVDIINEHTADAGVTVEGVLIENGGAIFNGVVGDTAQTTTLGVGAVTLAITRNFIVLTGDVGGNVLATITGGVAGQIIKILFTDALVTITDTDAVTADTVNLQTAFGSAANATLTLVHNGTKWFEVSRSPIGPFPASGKIYDITHADINEHSVALPAGYPANTRAIWVRGLRIAGTGWMVLYSVPATSANTTTLESGRCELWFRCTDNLFHYNISTVNDDWDIHALGYITS